MKVTREAAAAVLAVVKVAATEVGMVVEVMAVEKVVLMMAALKAKG